MTRQAMRPGVRRAIRLGAADPEHRPTSTTVHVAGAVGVNHQDRGYEQRCTRCGRVLVSVKQVVDLCPESSWFFAEGRRIAEGPHATYFISDRPLAADEQECELVPAFAWE